MNILAIPREEPLQDRCLLPYSIIEYGIYCQLREFSRHPPG
jgi:hypothetical protein